MMSSGRGRRQSEAAKLIGICGPACIALITSVVWVRYIRIGVPISAYLLWMPVALWMYAPFHYLSMAADASACEKHIRSMLAIACLFVLSDGLAASGIVGKWANAQGGVPLLVFPVFQLAIVFVMKGVLRCKPKE